MHGGADGAPEDAGMAQTDNLVPVKLMSVSAIRVNT